MPGDQMTEHRRTRLGTALGNGVTAELVDAILVSNLVNVRYLTGFSGSNGAVLVWSAELSDGQDDAIATDGRYTAQVAQQAPGLRAEIARDCPPALLRYAASLRAGLRLGIEAHTMTIAAFYDLRTVAADLDVELVPLRDTVERLREVRTRPKWSASRRRARSQTRPWRP